MASAVDAFKLAVKLSILDKTIVGSILKNDVAARFLDVADLILAIAAQRSIGMIGVATPDTDPGQTVGNRLWIATQQGTYSKFGNISVSAGEAIFIIDHGSGYSKAVLPTPATTVVNALNSIDTSAALSANKGRELKNMIDYINTGIDVYLFPDNLISYAWNGSGAIPTYITQNIDQLGRKLSSTGNSDSEVAIVDCGIQWGEKTNSVLLTSTLTRLGSVSPAVALGYGNANGIMWVGYRSDGSISLFQNAGNVTLLSPANTGFAYGVGAIVKIEIKKNGNVWVVRVNNGQSWSSAFNISNFKPTNSIVAGMRGRLDEVISLQTESLTPSGLAERAAKDFATAGDLVLQTQLETLQYGSPPNKFTNPPYPTTTLNPSYQEIASGVNQAAGVGGLDLTITTPLSNSLNFLNTGMQVDPTKVYKMFLTFTNTPVSDPAIGIAFGDSGTLNFKGAFYRKSGQVFGLTVSGSGNGTITGFVSPRPSDPQYAYGESNNLEIVADLPSGTLYTKVNDVTSPPLTISAAGLSGNVHITFRDRVAVSSIRIVAVNAAGSSSLSNGIYYVGTSGNDNNAGTVNNRFASINKAISKAIGKPQTKIVIAAGDYREVLDFSNLTWEKVELLSESKASVRILGSNSLKGWKKTPGYNNIFEIPFADTVPNWSRELNPIVEDKNPSKPISFSERHPLQKGLSHRLPYTLILQISVPGELSISLAALDSSPGRFVISGGKMFLHTSNSTDPTSNGFSYENIARVFNIPPPTTSLHAKAELTMKRLQFHFGTTGFRSSGFAKVTRYSCGAFCAISAGAWRDDAATVISYQDEAAGSDNDGFNGHYSIYSDYPTQDVWSGTEHCVYFDPWSHDNYDDGLSHHERHEVTIYGGLTEYNGDSGCRPSTGANWRVYNLYARKNGWQVGFTSPATGGEGISCVNKVLDGRNSTSCIAYNCISENNNVGYGTLSDSNNKLILVQCISRENRSAEFYSSQGTIVAKNCLVSNANPERIKLTAQNGVIQIENDTLLR